MRIILLDVESTEASRVVIDWYGLSLMVNTWNRSTFHASDHTYYRRVLFCSMNSYGKWFSWYVSMFFVPSFVYALDSSGRRALSMYLFVEINVDIMSNRRHDWHRRSNEHETNNSVITRLSTMNINNIDSLWVKRRLERWKQICWLGSSNLNLMISYLINAFRRRTWREFVVCNSIIWCSVVKLSCKRLKSFLSIDRTISWHLLSVSHVECSIESNSIQPAEIRSNRWKMSVVRKMWEQESIETRMFKLCISNRRTTMISNIFRKEKANCFPVVVFFYSLQSRSMTCW
jgi:hypothetical protein